MSYNIAVATSDGVNIDQGFGICDLFTIYEVDENGQFKVIEKRDVTVREEELPKDDGGMKCGGRALVKSEKLSDCRAVICSEIGFRVRKDLNSRGISIFDMEEAIDPVIEKIIAFYEKTDKHNKG